MNRRATDSDDFDSRTLRGGNGWAARIRALRQFVNEPGGTALLVLGFALGVFAGWIPSPLTRLEATIAAHDGRVVSVVAQRAETDRKLAEILTRLAHELATQNRRNAIRECAEIKEPDLRHRCLE